MARGSGANDFSRLAAQALLLYAAAGAATSLLAQTEPLPGFNVAQYSAPADYAPGPNRTIKGPDGNIWIAYYINTSQGITQGYVGQFGPTGTLLAQLPTLGNPTALTAGPFGDVSSIWFIENVNGVWEVGRVSAAAGTPPAITLEVPIPSTQSNAATPNGIASSSTTNSVYLTDTSNAVLWAVNGTAPGNLAWSTVAIDAPAYGIALGPDNNIWFTEYAFFDSEEQDVGNIAYITPPTSATTTFPLPQGYEAPTTFDAITTGPDLSSVWFSQYQGTSIYSISTTAPTGTSPTSRYPLANSTLNDMTLGPDFAIWFTQTFPATADTPPALGRIALNNGVVTEANEPVNSNAATFTQPYGITVGPNNNDLWFTDSGAAVFGDGVIIPRLVITPVALPNGQFGQPYSTNLVAGTASGGVPPYVNWQVATGSALPAGLTLSAGGVISGTPTGALGTTDFNVTVMDSNGSPYTQTASPQQFSITVTAGPPAAITATSGGGQSAQVNQTFANPLVATVTDSGGNPVTGASVTFSAPTLGPSGAFAGNATVLTNALGVATSPAFTANATAGGPYTVTAAVGGVANPASFALTNVVGPPANITATSGGGQSAQVNHAFANPLVATVTDGSGNPVSGASVTFSAPAAGASGTFAGSGTTAIVRTNASGMATSPVFTANATAGGPYNVSASVGGVANPASFALTNVAGLPANITATSGGGQLAQVNHSFANPLVATVTDGSGNPVSGASVTFSAPAAGASGSFAGNATVLTNASGVATSPTFTANAIAGGPYNVSASVNALSTSFSLTNVAGPPANITATSGGGQLAQVNHSFANPLVAKVTDASGNPVSGASVTFSAPAAGASATFAGNATVLTNASGVATSPAVTANAIAGGPYSVTASVNALSTSFALTNTPGPPASITATSGGGQSAQVNNAFSNPLVATVKDASGNLVSGATVTFSAPPAGASGTFAGSGITATVNTNASGVATSPAFTANATAGGPYTVSASVNGVANSASFSLTNSAGSPASITAISGGGQSAQVNHAFANPLVATVKDASGNLVSGVNVTFSAPASGASGKFAGNGTTAIVRTNASGVATSPAFTANATAGGPYTVSASVNGVANSASFSLTNTSGPPGSITATSGGGQSAQVKHAFANPLVATVEDASSNPVSGVTVTFSAPASGASGTFAGGGTTATVNTNASGVATSPVFTANATAGGPYTVTASATDVASPASFALTNTAGSAASITATSGGGQSAQVNQLFANKLIATVKDASGNPVSGTTVTFTAPTSGAGGTFTGGVTSVTEKTNASGVATSPAFTANSTAGSYSVTAALTGVASSASFALTNTAGAPGTITATSGSGQSAQVSTAFANPLVATVKDAKGNLVSGASVTFSAPASGASGTFAGGGITATVKTNASGAATSPAFTANATAGGPYTVTASVSGVTAPAAFALTNLPGSQSVTPTFKLTGLPSSPQPGASISSATVTSSAPFTGELSVSLSSTIPGFPAGSNGDAGFGTGFGSANKVRSITFAVPEGTSTINFPTPLDAGTVAGTLTATLSVQEQTTTPYSSTVTIDPLAPIIEAGSVQINNVTSTGFDVELVATSTTLDLKTATFTFTAAGGAQISGSSTFTADVSTLLPTWFSTAGNYQYGGAFSLSIPFTISGSASAIGSVSVTLTNSVGTSAAVSGTQ